MEREDSETSNETSWRKPAKRPKTFHRDSDATYMEMLRKVEDELSEDELKELIAIASIESEDFKIGGKDSKPTSLLAIERSGLFSEDNLSWLEEALMKVHNSTATNIVCTFTYGKDDSDHDFPSEPESSDNEEEDERPSTVDNLLECIGRIGPRVKFTLQEFLTVRDYANNPNIMHEFWQTITALDHRIVLSQTFLPSHVSMRDFIYSLLCCSDNFLRQDIIEKLSACQLAVPFLLQGENGKTPEVLLWACRRIVKKWKGEQDAFSVEQPIVNYPTFIVSFLRIGEIFFSKSQLLNRMLSSSQGYDLHNFFLNKESDKVKPRLSSGNVEAIWFLPMSGKEKEKLKYVSTFFNLRGDSSEYPAQTNFCCKASDLLVVFISDLKMKYFENLIQTICKEPRKVLLVEISDSELLTIRDSTDLYRRIRASKTQVHQIEQMVCDFIVQCSQEESTYRKLAELDPYQSNDLQFDTDRNESRTARELVRNIFDSVSFESVAEFKKKCFPLQESWQEWVKLDKTRFDSENVKEDWSFEQQMDATMEGKRQKRMCQLQKNFSKTMKVYYDAIKNSEHFISLSQYFYCFLREKILETVYKDTIESMTSLSVREGEKIEDVKHGNDSEHALQSTDQIVNDVTTVEKHKKFMAGNLGAEHFLREMGQLYEAYTEIKDKHSLTNDTADIPLFPSIYANFALQMHPLEIMDGDTGFVPITWLTAVLDKMAKQLQNPKVLVLSVVGVQSSGKSTLLNSMFGLRFPVRAGRCTRGLFARFLKIESNFAEKLGFKYLIIVDTEGIKSIDHEDHRFDNELVTFALSIANVTFFNLSGENIGPDVAGILQIAAHALMRMKEVDLECRIKIIQQRVSDLTAEDRNKSSVDKIKETLDLATKFAAEEEGLEGRYKRFSDVVELNFDEDLQYVPTLWSGGMTPPNHMYGEKVTRIRESLLRDITNRKITPDLTLSTFTDRIIDVWRAVKEENFIFNFKDSVRAVDFNKFCLEYNRWVVEMRQSIMDESLACLDYIPSLISSGGDIESLKCVLDDEVDNQSKLLRKKIEDYIAMHPRKVMISKYKQGFLQDIHIALKDAKNQALQRISDEFDIQKLEHNLPKLGGKWLVRMITDVKKLAQEIRTSGEPTSFPNINDIDTEARFIGRYSHRLHAPHGLQNLWKKWTKDIKRENGITQINITPSDIKTFCDKHLLKTTRDMSIGSEIHNLFDKEGGIEKHIGTIDFCKYISDKHVKAWIKGKQKSANGEKGSCEKPHESLATEQIFMEKQRAVNTMKAYIDEAMNDLIQQETYHFDRNAFQLLVRKTLRNLSEKTDDDRKLPRNLIAKGLMHLCARAFDEVFKHVEIRDDNFSVFFEVEDKMVSQHFIRFIAHREIERSASELLFYYIEKELEKQLQNCIKSTISKHAARFKLPWDILGNTYKALMSLLNHRYWSSVFLYTHFMSPLQELKDIYNQQQERTVLVDEAYRVRHNAIILLKKWEEDLNKSLSFKDWIDKLIQTFSTDSSVQQIVNIYDTVQLITVSQYLRAHVKSWVTNIVDDYKFLYSSLKIESVLSNVCQKECPMCGMFCDNTMETHTIHSSYLHRPRGMARETYSGTRRMVLEDCSTSLLLSDAISTRSGRMFHCKDYKQYHPDWEIKPDRNNPGKVFWRWFFVQLAKRYFYGSNSDRIYYTDSHFVEFPESWLKITEAEALQSLQDDKKIKLEGRQRSIQSEEANPGFFTNCNSPDISTVVGEDSHS